MSYSLWIGHKVEKVSGKPFKSGQKIATVKSVTTNPNSNKIAFDFYEDDSVVDCIMCKLSVNTEEENMKTIDRVTRFNGVSVHSNDEVMDEIENITKVFTTEHGGEIIVDGRGLDEDTMNEIALLLDVDVSILEDNMISVYS